MPLTPPPPPPIDPQVAAALDELGISPGFTADEISQAREESALFQAEVLERIAPLGLRRDDSPVSAFRGGLIDVSSFTPPGMRRRRAAILYVHGGGMVSGDRFSGMDFLASWAIAHDVVVVTADYRLAPEFPDPYPVEDTFAVLTWMVERADDLEIDPHRIVIVGVSAGGGIAAGTALLARERGGPQLLGQMLLCPMLDDRDATISTKQIDGIGYWDRGASVTAWTALLGERRATDDVSIFAAPARAEHLSGLPPTFIDVGSAEVFRDESVAYATAIWAAGGAADLHVWAGGVHAYELLAPDAAISRETVRTRDQWLRRTFESSLP